VRPTWHWGVFYLGMGACPKDHPETSSPFFKVPAEGSVRSLNLGLVIGCVWWRLRFCRDAQLSLPLIIPYLFIPDLISLHLIIPNLGIDYLIVTYLTLSYPGNDQRPNTKDQRPNTKDRRPKAKDERSKTEAESRPDQAERRPHLAESKP